MREMGSFFRKKDSSDKKRLRKPPFGIKRDAEPASEKELKDAVKAIQEDAEYSRGKRISVDILKDEFNTIRNWIEKNPPADLKEDKGNQLGTLEKAARDAFNNIRPTKYKRGDVAAAEQAFRTATHKYLEYIEDHSDKIKNLIEVEPALEKELYEAMKAIYKDENYILGERMGVDRLKDKFNTVSNWIKKNFPESEDQKERLDGLEKSVNDALNKIQYEKLNWGDISGAEKYFRKSVHNYAHYVQNNIDEVKNSFVNNVQKELLKSEKDAYEIVNKKSEERKERISDELIRQSLETFYEFSPRRKPTKFEKETFIDKLLNLKMISGNPDDYYCITAKPIIPGKKYDKEDIREDVPHIAIINVEERNMISFSIYRNEDQEWRNENFPSNFRKEWNLEEFPEEFGQALHASDLRAAFYQKAVEEYLSRSDTLGGAAQQPKHSISDFSLRVIVGFNTIENITRAIFSGFGKDDGVTKCSTSDDGRSRILASHFGKGTALMCHDYPNIVGHGEIGDSEIYKIGGGLKHIKISIRPKTEIAKDEIVEIS